MTVRISAELRKSFFELTRLSHVLHKDTQIAVDEMLRLALEYNRGFASGDDVMFWVKIVIRSFLAQVDGLAYAMRRAVVQNAQRSGLTLTMKERARLSERKYDASNDVILDLPSHLSTEESIKVAFRFFPQLFGVNSVLNTSGEEWRGFKRVVAVRNKLAHPRMPEDLVPLNALSALHPTLLWFYSQIMGLLSDIGSNNGMVAPLAFPVGDLPKFRDFDSPWRVFFTEEDVRIVKDSGSRTLEYINKMFEIMKDDLLRGYDLIGNSLDNAKAFDSARSQFAFRTLLRLVFSDIEGYINAARFQIDAAAVRGKVHLTESEAASLEEGELEDRLASAMTLWAREFGNDWIARREGADWVRLKAARELRNKITHPRSVDSVTITLRQTDTIIHANDYLMNNLDALLIDGEKWALKGGSVYEAIEAACSNSEDLSGDRLNDSEDLSG